MSTNKIIYGFLGIDSKEKSLKGSNLSWLKQIHSACCVEVRSLKDIDHNIEADAQITCVPNIILAVKTADCVPILLYDQDAGVVGAIHAGWRGALSGIIAATVEQINHTKPSNLALAAIIGPCIRQKSYEVEEEFFEQFIDTDPVSSAFFMSKKGKTSKKYFDLPGYVKELLRRAGVLKVEDIGIDTFTDDKFFSHRRAVQTGHNAGRNFSFIGIK